MKEIKEGSFYYYFFLQMLLLEDETVRTGSPLHQAKPGPYEFAIHVWLNAHKIGPSLCYLPLLLAA